MAEFPSMPLMTDAYIADTMHLTNEEHGIYLKFLIHAWRSPRCCLPKDDETRRLIAGVTKPKWKNIREKMMDFWDLEEIGYTQKKMQTLRGKIEKNKRQKSIAGKASFRAKSLKNNKSVPTAVGDVLQRLDNGEATNQNQNQNIIKNNNKSGGLFVASRWFSENEIDRLKIDFPNLDVVSKLQEQSFREWCFQTNPQLPKLPARRWFEKQGNIDKLVDNTIEIQKDPIKPSEGLLKTNLFKNAKQ